MILGWAPEQACNHSTAQLRLLIEAAERERARIALDNLEATLAGVAPTVSKAGGKAYDALKTELNKRIDS